MKTKIIVLSAIATALLAPSVFAKANIEVVVADQIKWGKLNPARGEASPKAFDLWGERTKNVATGMLVGFKKGFSSPPHIHNITYRGIVIEGLMHNDDPNAAKMWLPPLSYWTQPVGEDHITAANGDNNLIFLEIDTGPYLVQPSTKAYDNGERPLNVDQKNIIWHSAKDIEWLDSDSGIEMAALWGKPAANENYGTMLKLPAGFNGELQTKASEFKIVIIKGYVDYKNNGKTSHLNAGSYVGSDGQINHKISTKQEAVIYVKTNSRFEVTAN